VGFAAGYQFAGDLLAIFRRENKEELNWEGEKALRYEI